VRQYAGRRPAPNVLRNCAILNAWLKFLRKGLDDGIGDEPGPHFFAGAGGSNRRRLVALCGG